MNALAELNDCAVLGRIVNGLPEICCAQRNVAICDPAMSRVIHVNLNPSVMFGDVIPEHICGLTGVESITITGDVRGELPVCLGSLTQLKRLSIINTGITGSLPESISAMSKLEVLAITQNYNMTGSLPDAFSDMPMLKDLDLSRNGFTGSIPESMSSLSALERLNMNKNKLTGSIPDMSNNRRMRTIDLSMNQLSGALPKWFEHLKVLLTLNLSFNKLSGRIPAAIAGAFNINYLILEHNEFSGEIPHEIGTIVGLKYLWLGHNRLTGTVPATLGQLFYLENWRMQSNLLRGPLPDATSEFLTEIDWSDNRFTGRVPASFNKLGRLQYLLLDANCLSPVLPISLRSNPFLQTRMHNSDACLVLPDGLGLPESAADIVAALGSPVVQLSMIVLLALLVSFKMSRKAAGRRRSVEEKAKVLLARDLKVGDFEYSAFVA